jgi:hypothetical protein
MSIMRSNIARQLYNTGGITNLINTYQNNPTLQSQMTQQEYLDLFGSRPTSSTTEQIVQSSVAPTIQPIVKKPILPIIPQESGGDGGGGITNPGINRFDYGYDSLAKNTLDEEGAGGYKTRGTDANIAFLEDIAEGTIPEEDYTLSMRLGDTATGIRGGVVNAFNQLKNFSVAKQFKDFVQDRLDRGEKIARDKRIADAKAAIELAKARERAMLQNTFSGGDSSLNTGPGGSYTGRGDEGATGANFSGDFATDSASYDL